MRWKVTFQIAATYIGAVMGAGFASGQEIFQFFVRFGYKGIWGIILSAALFAVLGWIMIDLIIKWRINSYTELFERLFGQRWGKRTDILITILIFVGLLAMLSGSGSLFYQYFGFSKWLGILLTSIVIAVALWNKGEGVLWINSVLIPLKFIFCFGIGLIAILFAASGDGEGIQIGTNPIVKNWIASSIIYVAFNLTLAMVVFASLSKNIQKSGARLGALLGGVALGVFALVIGVSLLRFPDVLGLEIPMVAVAGKLGDWSAFIYMIVLWFAMITAAIGNGFSLVTRIVETSRFNYLQSMTIVLILVFPLAGIKFSQIVEIIYPLFGYVGLIFIPALLYGWYRR